MKAKIFIASSTEGLDVAKAIQSNLDLDFETTIWSQDIFKLSSYTLESLFEALYNNDYGIFVFSPDDKLSIRGENQISVRDNVIFELGLFVGRFGKNYNFIVQPRGIDIRIPSDLYGLTIATYDPDRSDGNLTASLGQACTQITQQINELYKIDYPEKGHYGKNILHKETASFELNKEYSFRAKLTQSQILIIHMRSKDPNSGMWGMSIKQMGDWVADRFDHEKREQFFHLKGPTDSDLQINFSDSLEIEVIYHENGNEPTFSKELSGKK